MEAIRITREEVIGFFGTRISDCEKLRLEDWLTLRCQVVDPNLKGIFGWIRKKLNSKIPYIENNLFEIERTVCFAITHDYIISDPFTRKKVPIGG